MANTVLVTGNTYPVKDSLKALGARWDAANKGWRVPESKAAEAQALVSGSAPVKGAPKARKPSGPRAPRPKMIGEHSDLCCRFEGSKQNRASNRKIGSTYWIKDRGQRVACVVIGIQEATWYSGDNLEDMGDYSHGGYGAYLGMDYFRHATLAEYEALQASDPRADGVAPAAPPTETGVVS